MNKVVLFLIFYISYSGSSQEFVYSYIDNYSDIAVNEMNTTGIPASITLAQGMLESNWGRSELATKAKNHFGIKCGNNWEGGTFSWEDDEYHKGKLVKSCFRVYDAVYESFHDHSDFLLKKRYKFLFDYDVYDYKSWAKGLVKAGYATDKKYASKLITIIEKYGLFEYDNKYTPIANSGSIIASSSEKIKPKSQYRISYINNCKVVYAKYGDTPKSLEKQLGISQKKIKRYNKELFLKKKKAKEGDIVYLEKKKRKYHGIESVYITTQKTSLAEISQRFGVSLKQLAKLNKTKTKIKFRKGRKVLLKRKSKRIEWASAVREDKKYIFDEALSPKQ